VADILVSRDERFDIMLKEFHEILPPTEEIWDDVSDYVVTPEHMNTIYATIEECGNVVEYVIVNPIVYAELKKIEKWWKPSSYAERRDRGCYGKLWSTEVFVTDKCPKNLIYARGFGDCSYPDGRELKWFSSAGVYGLVYNTRPFVRSNLEEISLTKKS
jgi:hypothetical protein